MQISAQTRKDVGTSASRRLRRAKQVPGIVYGGEAAPVQIALDHNALYYALRVEAFHSSILDMDIDGKTQRVLLRNVQWHPYKQQVLHVDFQRVAANQKINVKVPLHFINAEISPAVKLNKAVVNQVMTEIEVSVLPKDLPEFIEVDLAELTMDHSMHLSGIKLPKGVTPVVAPGTDPVLASATLVGASDADAGEAADGAAAEGEAK
ncbi:50S ribosomal protein L25/general stress protein Ctc [Lautropia dentalis]|jgi:ribosomal protein L25, Ctc-form|uniref:Large ribosomal subunit protein bL25 n=1 Tax=Lautropia dentalis TaxID=2490857 RepID=A0A426FN57_9BURK|nr:50S ribosomal protein L25/general stress protein Ctc [Lautropia dentalis]RRN44116.1 50S ribosomal protein L25/general stress protein Ctc [Lautropia dentalis]